MLGWVFSYNDIMKFAKLLLESYGKLYEQDQKGFVVVFSTARGLQQGATQELTPPNGGSTAIVGRSQQEGNPYVKGGPFGGGQRSLGALSPEDKERLNNWWAGKEDPNQKDANQEEQPQDQEQVEQQDPFAFIDEDPMFEKLKQVDRDRLKKLEAAIPGTVGMYKDIYENSLKVLEGYTGPTRGGEAALSEDTLYQKVFGGKSRGSLAYSLEREIDANAVKIDRTKSVAFALDPIEISELSGSIEMMRDFSNAFAQSSECNSDNVDLYEKVNDRVRKSPDTSAVDKASTFFFSTPLDDKRFGISLNVAEQNPINLMASRYNDNIRNCEGLDDPERYTIPEKAIEANWSSDSGNIGNKVKDASEQVKLAAYYAFIGDKKAAAEEIQSLQSKFGKDIFEALKMSRAVKDGEQALYEGYQETMDSLSEMGIASPGDIKKFVAGPLKNFFLESMDFLIRVKPDHAARVGGGSVGKGDKSDVDYVWNSPKDLGMEGIELEEVKFEDLDKDMQKEIRRKGGDIQATYYQLPESLKTYIKEGDVKVGDSYRTSKEAERLLGEGPESAHGDAVWDMLLEGRSDQEKQTDIAEGRKVLRELKTASDRVRKLLGPLTTPSYKSREQARKFISSQVTEIMGTIPGKKKFIEGIMKEWEKNGSEKAIGLLDREVQMMTFNKYIKRDRSGKVNKEKSRAGLLAIASMQASMGVDTTKTKKNCMSTIHILSSGNTYREKQNTLIVNPLKELLDPKSSRTIGYMGESVIRISNDGSMEFKADKGRCAGMGKVNTNNLTPESQESK